MTDVPNQAPEYWLADCPACGAIGPDYCPRPRCEDPRYINTGDDRGRRCAMTKVACESQARERCVMTDDKRGAPCVCGLEDICDPTCFSHPDHPDNKDRMETQPWVPEVKLEPGWLARDILRAIARLKEWIVDALVIFWVVWRGVELSRL